MEQGHGIQAIQSQVQTQRVREAERQRLEQVGELLFAVQGVSTASSTDLAIEDRLSLGNQESAPSTAVSGIQLPQAGQPLPVEPGEYVLPVDGRGAAVALQEKLQTLLDTPEFEEMAQALGVQDISRFARAVERGDALETFALIDPSNIYLVDAQRREIHADQLASFARAALVIRPQNSSQVLETADPGQQLQQRLENPVLARIEDPALQIQDQLVQRPPQPQDASAVIG